MSDVTNTKFPTPAFCVRAGFHVRTVRARSPALCPQQRTTALSKSTVAIMRVTTAVLAVLLVSAASLALAAAAAANPYCDPSYDCGFHYTAPDGSKSYDFDLSSLCTGDDYALLDRSHHTYYARICGTASQNCLPGACALGTVCKTTPQRQMGY